MNWKHTLHILRRDCHAQRFHLIQWAVLLVLYVGILSQWELGRPAGASVWTVLAHLLPAVIMVYGLVIVVVLIHQDPVTGTSAFWLTRPVRGISLFAAKAIEAISMVALWIVADLLVLAGNGAVDHAGYFAFDLATGLLPIALIALVIAALVPNTARFLLAVALTTAGFALLAMALRLVGDWFFVSDSTTGVSRSIAERLSAQVLGAVIVSLGAIAILGWQFVTRRTRISVVTALAIAAGASVAVSAWRYDFIGPNTDLSRVSSQFDAVKVEIDRSVLRSGTTTESTGDRAPVEYRSVSAQASIHGLPDGIIAEWESASTRVIAADGQEFLQSRGSFHNRMSVASISAALDGAIIHERGQGERWHSIVKTSDDEFEKFAHQPCTVESEFLLQLFRYELIGELPLKVGAQVHHDGLQVLITNVVNRPSIQTTHTTDGPQTAANPNYECEVHFSEKYPNSKLKAVRNGNNSPDPNSNVIYVLVNRESGEAVLSNGGGSSSFSGIRMMFHFRDRHLDFEPAYTGNGIERLPKIDEEWIAGASLAILRRKPIGEITRTAVIEDVVFAPEK